MMAIRNPGDVIQEAVAVAAKGGIPSGAKLVTADRLFVVAFGRELIRAANSPDAQRLHQFLDVIESEIHAAAASKGTNDDDRR